MAFGGKAQLPVLVRVLEVISTILNGESAVYHATGACMYLIDQNMKEKDSQLVGRGRRGSAILHVQIIPKILTPRILGVK